MRHMNGTAMLLIVLFLAAVPETATGRPGQRRIQLNSTPSGATISIDGERQTKTTPMWINLRPGTYRLRLELAGYAPHEEELTVRRSWARHNYQLVAQGRLQLNAADPSAEGARVSLDGVDIGAIPLDHQLMPGSHQVLVSREGYHDATRIYEVVGGQTYAAEIALEALPPPRGEVLVAADVSGASVVVDGVVAGTTPTILELEPGPHTLELRSGEFEPFTQVVTVVAGERQTVNATMRPQRAPGGTLLVLTAPDAASVLVDGQERGPAPLTIEDLAPGSHIVEARHEGYETASTVVEVEARRQATIRLELETVPQGGGIRVVSSVPGAAVFLDGATLGPAPAVGRDIEPGEHRVVVQAPGHRDWERRVLIQAGESLLVEATPDGFGRLHVTADVENAEVFVDGQIVGPVPLRHELPTGDHQVEIRAEGQAPLISNVLIEAGATNSILAQLRNPRDRELAPVAALPDRSGPRFTKAGFPVPPGSIAFDAGWGWPYIAGAYRLTVGVWDGVDWARLGVGLEVRSSVWLTEVDARLGFGARLGTIFRLGVELGLGVAVGPGYDDTDQRRAGFILNLLLTQGFKVGPVAFGLIERLEFSIDTHGELGNTGLVRQTWARGFVGAFTEWQVHRVFHLWLTADYAPKQKYRRILCADAWDSGQDRCSHSWMRDINLNVQVGLGLRFR